MTFLSRRKRQTTLPGSPAKWAATIISIVLAWSAPWSSARAQVVIPADNSQVIIPKFVPVGQRPLTGIIPATQVVPAAYQQPKEKKMTTDDPMDYLVRTELPGPQSMFKRESEAQFYERIRQDAKRQTGGGPAIFPEEPIVSKESYRSSPYPRIDPRDHQPFAQIMEIVEPSYVCHNRSYFEQPNFERAGWNFGVLQPPMEISVFLYDWVLLPYHVCSDLKVRGQCSAGKCLPGDPAPFTVPIERFSVTGVIGEAAAIIGLAYLFP